jgi:N-acetylglucosaminyl-diphospho-decaprenol L-rhamnosyltransferase
MPAFDTDQRVRARFPADPLRTHSVTLSIIIVNFRSANYLERCLSSIYNSPLNLDFEVIVVDSGSFDGSAEMLETRFPAVLFIQSENIGFARANNLGVASSSGRYLLFLNPDTEVVANALEQLVRTADSVNDTGIIGCKLLNADGTIQTSCVQAFPTILNQMLNAEVLRQRFPNSRLWGISSLLRGNRAPCNVEAISGACMLSRREVFQAVGGFSEDYFMYSEDIDLCYKVKATGLSNYIVPSAEVIHFGGASSKSRGSTFSDVMIFNARYKFFRTHRGLVYAAAYRVATVAAACGRLVLLFGSAVLTATAPDRLRGDASFAWEKWKAILRWSLGLERWVANFR